MAYKWSMEKQNNPRVPVTLTPDQRDLLEAKAAKLGLTISAYIRMAALEKANKDE